MGMSVGAPVAKEGEDDEDDQDQGDEEVVSPTSSRDLRKGEAGGVEGDVELDVLGHVLFQDFQPLVEFVRDGDMVRAGLGDQLQAHRGEPVVFHGGAPVLRPQFPRGPRRRSARPGPPNP